jgi:DNA-binding NtrC family response regulator
MPSPPSVPDAAASGETVRVEPAAVYHARGARLTPYLLDALGPTRFNRFLVQPTDPQQPELTIAVIDDDALVLSSLRNALTGFGFAVQTFSDPLAAIDRIREDRPDIVITDIRMPQCDGFEVLKRLKEGDPDCEVIFITAYGQIDVAVRALREGAADFIEKPFNSDALRAAVERTRRFHALSQQQRVLSGQLDVLSQQVLARGGRNVMLGQAQTMARVAEETVAIANTNATVLILGETGTGKELVAHAIHRLSKRSSKPFITVNCPSIPEDLFESEMFGHRRGSFTGAVESRPGYVEAAEGGTLFLDEIGDLPLSSQAKILRLLEQRTYLPVGERRERMADVRVIAATNQALERLIEQKKFREDLYYRLRVCSIGLPPLRERRQDIPLLALYFTLQFAAEMNKPVSGLDESAMRHLASYDYPGNVRELRNIVESALIRCRHAGTLSRDDLPLPSASALAAPAVPPNAWPLETVRFQDVERMLYQEVLNRSDQNVSAAARVLGLSRGKLRRRLASLGIQARDSG